MGLFEPSEVKVLKTPGLQGQKTWRSKHLRGLASEIPGVGTTIPVYSLGGQRLADLAVGPDETVAALKEKLCEATGRNQLMDLASELLILQDSDIVWKTGILEGGHLQALVFNESVPHGWTQQTGKTDAEVTMRFSWQRRLLKSLGSKRKFLGTAGPTSGLGILASVLLQFPDELLAAGTDDRHVFDAWYAAGTSTEP
eukprot:g24377.t1